MPDNATVYYAQVGYDRTPENPYNVFRKMDHPDSQTIVEVYDRLTRTWIERRDLIRYTGKSEDAAVVIPKAQAEAIIRSWAW